MDYMIQEGELVKVTLEIRIPKMATADEVEEWLRFSLNDNGSMCVENPLRNEMPEPWGPFSFGWESSERIGRREEFNHEKTETGVRYSVRYHRDPKSQYCGKSVENTQPPSEHLAK